MIGLLVMTSFKRIEEDEKIEEDSKMQKEEVYHQRRSRKVSAPAETTTTTAKKHAIQERERTSCAIATKCNFVDRAFLAVFRERGI